MTISSTLNRTSQNGNDVSVDFTVSFPFHKKADLVVLSTVIATGVSTLQTLVTDYDISGTTDSLGHYSSGGTVTFVTAPASTVRITIYRDPTRTQGLDLKDADKFPAENTEAQLDYVTMLVQRVHDLIARSVRQPDGDSTDISALPSSVDRASKFLAFDASGEPISASGVTSVPVSSFMETVLDDTTAAAARTTLGAASATYEPIIDSLKQAITNPIINGNMEIWQRGTSFVSPATNTYTADRWKWRLTGSSAAVTINRSTNVPTVAQAGVLFNYSLEVDVTTADASVAAGDLVILEHDIEGYNWRHFAQRAITLSFWVRDTVTGTHYIALANTSEDAVNNINIFSDYTINVADTWEYKTISFVASPSAGTWDYTNGCGLRVKFILMAGVNFQGANEDQWNGGGSQTISNSGIVNSMSSTSNFFRITGVKMEIGSAVTPIQYVPFEEELARCQRYYEKGFDYATAPAQNVGYAFTRWNAIIAGAVTQYSPTVRYRVPKRGSVTLTFYNPNAANAEVRNLTDAADLSATAYYTNQEDGFIVQATGTAGTAVNEILGVNWAASSEL